MSTIVKSTPGKTSKKDSVLKPNVRRLRELGVHIVADPTICHGKPTFRGTRVFVTDVLDQVARGMSWDRISREWRGTVTKEAIAEALVLSRNSFVDHLEEYCARPAGRTSEHS